MARSLVGGTRRSVGAWSGLIGSAAWLMVAGCESGSGSSIFSGNSSNDEASPSAAISGGTKAYSNNGASLSTGGTGANLAVVTTPEQKVVVDFDAPQSSKNYVYATNTERDSVAVIDATTLAIHVVNTGDQPRFLRTLPGKDAALLVDVGANDLAYIETADGKSAVSYYRDLPSANVVAVAPDGNHAIAYFDVSRMQQGKFETLQDVSVMSFGATGAVATRMTVGFKPRQVTFAGGPSGSAAAYVVTDDGVSVLDFAQIDATQKSAIASTIPMFSATEPKGESVSVTPDGAFAVGRIEGTTRIRLVELSSGKSSDLDLATLLPAVNAPINGTGGAASTSVAEGVGGTSSNTFGTAGGGGSLSSGGTQASGGTSESGGSKTTATNAAHAGAAGDERGDSAGAAGLATSIGGKSNGGGGTSASSTASGGVSSTGTSSSSMASGGNSATSSTTTVAQLPAADITDLVVSPDGSFALAVSRSRGVLLRVPIPGGFANPSLVTTLEIDDITVGSVAISPNGKWAVLFTTVVESERRIVIVDLSGAVEQRALDLKKTVKGVAFSSSGDQAYVLHNKASGDPTALGIDTQTVLDRSYGYSLVNLSKAFRKLVVTVSDPNLSVTTPDAPYVFLTFGGQSTAVQRLDMESLQVDEVGLGSIPISLGVVPAAKRVFVNQAYAEGRLTFVDWMTLNVQTVTGYELNSKIRE